jgi:photosystem II stability/assembly factor-like uncharacterized protein
MSTPRLAPDKSVSSGYSAVMLMICRNVMHFHKCLIVLLGLFLCLPLRAEKWIFLGPDGGDARSLAYDPRNPDHVFLGTSTGSIFVSTDGGQSWSRFAHLGSRDNYVLDHIIIDPRNSAVIFASAWNVEDNKAGDVFRSRDGGETWTALPAMHEKSVRALAMAPSDSNVLVSGTLEGVYRSQDGGENWQRISPANHAEIKNIEAIAIDPKDPNLIYAGTWHLAWKTTDGGTTWRHINQGMVDDSDVFSIIIDPMNPSLVYASACSGIYKSESAGDIFRKIQGIPFAARRTRMLKQAPNNSNVVYAGTTQGLWKTIDAGKTWKQMTNSEVVVNDVFVDPRNSSRLLLATDRGGVMVSENSGLNLSSYNYGYTHRYVTTILADMNDPRRISVGIANDHEWGGVFSFRDGRTWQQRSNGLGGRDVFALKQAANGTLIAGTNRGVFLLDRNATAWRPSINTTIDRSSQRAKRTIKNSRLGLSSIHPLMDAKVNDIEVASERWLAATSSGLFTSADQGRSWEGGAVLGRRDFVSVQCSGRLLVAATHTEILTSPDQGTNWQVAALPSRLTTIRGLTFTPNGDILVASREGAFRSSDSGKTWEHVLNGLPEQELSSVSYDESTKVLLATSLSTGVIFLSDDGGRSWSRGPDVGYPLRRVKLVRGRYVAATAFDGVIAQQ